MNSLRRHGRKRSKRGLSALSPTDVVASWGSDYADVSRNHAEIYAARIAATLP